MVLFGTLTDTSIGALLIAGIVPGLLTATVFSAGILIASWIWPGLSGEADRTFTLREKLVSLKGIWPLGVLVFVMLFGIYTGVMPPTAAGGVGATATILLGLVRRKLTLAALWEALGETVRMTAALLIIILGGLMFGRMLLITGILGDLLNLIGNLNMPAWQFLIVLVIFYLFLGMFVDSISMMVMTLPFVFPIVHSMGFNAVWFGVIVVKLAELGTITPPVGINLFAVAAAGRESISIKDVMVGIWPFVVLDLIVLTLLIVFPGIVTALVPARL
jgi:tripartite ATP-independent transporter DctM subunit